MDRSYPTLGGNDESLNLPDVNPKTDADLSSLKLARDRSISHTFGIIKSAHKVKPQPVEPKKEEVKSKDTAKTKVS